MTTTLTEIAADIYRISTYIEPADLVFNQFLIAADEPLLFHAGPRALFEYVAATVAHVIPVHTLRWITFGHVESDECGAMSQWLAAAPDAQVAHGALGCAVSINDIADLPPRPLVDGEVLDIGGHRLQRLETPHVPHGWDAGLLFDQTTGPLLCGDLFTAAGAGVPSTEADPVGPALTAEDLFRATCLTPSTGPTIRGLAQLAPTTLALMHGPAFHGDCATALTALATAYDERHAAAAESHAADAG